MYDKIKVYDKTSDAFYRNANGKAFLIDFEGYNADPGQFKIISGVYSPLTGDNIVFTENTTAPFSNNIYYDAIPFEMLRTYESEPQLIVTVDGNPAVCHNMTCDLAYITPDATVTAFTYTESTKVLTITGTDLPTTIDEMQDVIFADTYCIIDESSMSATGMSCTLESDPVCGDHNPIVHATRGYIPTSSLTAESIACTITAVTPTTSLNVLGGDNLTFTGTFLPKDLSVSTITVVFNDADSTNCTPKFSNSSTLVCLTSAFAESSLSATLTPTITINGVA